MPEPGKEEKIHQVRWSLEDWDRIELAAHHIGRDQHLEMTPTDIIRIAVRRLCEEKLGPAVAA